jgi:hypothetical protein
MKILDSHAFSFIIQLPSLYLTNFKLLVMEKHFTITIAYIYLLLGTSCRPMQQKIPNNYNGSFATIKGNVKVFTGNQMPSHGSAPKKGKPYSTSVYFFTQLKKEWLVDLDGQFCKNFTQVQPFKFIESDAQGDYIISLPEGAYFVLLGYEDGFFIPFFDSNNQISPVQLKVNQKIQLDVNINSKAVY